MAKTTDELFAEATEADYETSTPVVLAASDTEEEFQFRIDEHLRTITIPEKGVVAGVEGDLNVNIARFTMVRYYHGRDLSKLNIRINYRNANGQVNYYTVSDATISGDSIVFSWEYAADVTQYKGNVQFVVYLFSATNAVLKQRFFSTLGTLEVLEGLEVDSSIPASEQTDILLHLKKDLSAYAEEVKKSLPADYTAMTEQVGSLKEDLMNANTKSVFCDASELIMVNSVNSMVSELPIGWAGVETYEGYTWSSPTERTAKEKYTCTEWFILPEGIYTIPSDFMTSDPYGKIKPEIFVKTRKSGEYISKFKANVFFAQSECMYAVTLPTQTFDKYVLNNNFNFNAVPVVIDIAKIIEDKNLSINSSGILTIDITEYLPVDKVTTLAYMYFINMPDFEFAWDDAWSKTVKGTFISSGNPTFSYFCLGIYVQNSITYLNIRGVYDKSWFSDRDAKIVLGVV